MGRSAWLNIRNATTTGFPKSLCQEDRRWQIVRCVSRGPYIVEMVSMEGALDVDVLQFRMQSREMFQNTLMFLGLPLNQLHNYNTGNRFPPRLANPRTEWGRRTTCFRAFNNWASLTIELKRDQCRTCF